MRAVLRYVDLEKAHLNPSHHDAIHEGVDDAHLEVDGPSPRRCPPRSGVSKDGDPDLK